MWPQSADVSPSSVVARGLGSLGLIWSAATRDAGAGCRGYMIDVPVYSVLD